MASPHGLLVSVQLCRLSLLDPTNLGGFYRQGDVFR